MSQVNQSRPIGNPFHKQNLRRIVCYDLTRAFIGGVVLGLAYTSTEALVKKVLG